MAPAIFILLPFNYSLHTNLIFSIALRAVTSRDFYILLIDEFTSPFNFDNVELRLFSLSWPLWNKELNFSVKENFYLTLNCVAICSKYLLTLDCGTPYFFKISNGF
jgi:hypothetical protein